MIKTIALTVTIFALAGLFLATGATINRIKTAREFEKNKAECFISGGIQYVNSDSGHSCIYNK